MKLCNGNSGRGRIHSIESFATQDGPGIRFLVFMQGCFGRCLYCQNPDTWDLRAGFEMSAKELFEKIERCIPYIQASKGGVTVSGGEPLLQIGFLIKLFRLCKKNNTHTAIDTSAFTGGYERKQLDTLIPLTDLFIVDIKAADEKLHRKITSRDLSEALDFLNILEAEGRAYWLRYVLVPGLNDSKKDIRLLKGILAGFRKCERFEFLPYHTLGKHKWEHMNLRYPLNKTAPAQSRQIKKARSMLAAAIAQGPVLKNKDFLNRALV